MLEAAPRKIDCHVHLLGDGSSGSGCWLRLKSIAQRLQAQVMVRAAGIPAAALRGGLDVQVEASLAGLLGGSSLDALVLLAQDIPHRDDGTPLPDKGAFFVPNNYLLEVCARHPGRFIPAVSIHPARHDALEELERCLQAGARVLKLLPNCLNVDYGAPQHRPFWEKMAAANMVLLSHTGGEFSLPVLCRRFADPRLLRYPLECGVTVIAAHCGGRSGLWDPDYTAILLAMFERWPRLFGDNSALCTPLRCRTLPLILPDNVRRRIVHGSDFPIPVNGFGPWRMGLIDRDSWRRSSQQPNVLERDVMLKRAIGFDEANLTLMDELLGHR
ncbi:MAG: amidohydrolase family protein [Verrucomicrobiota bacterium]